MTPIDEKHKVFVLAPFYALGADAIKNHCSLPMTKRPVILTGSHDIDKIMGLERVHVIELVSPRPWGFNNVRHSAQYGVLRKLVCNRWLAISNRGNALGNMWIMLNLP
jgi:hypothetical protein